MAADATWDLPHGPDCVPWAPAPGSGKSRSTSALDRERRKEGRRGGLGTRGPKLDGKSESKSQDGKRTVVPRLEDSLIEGASKTVAWTQQGWCER